MAIPAIAKKKGLDRQYIRLRNRLDPVIEVGGAKPGCGNSFPVEPGSIAFLYGFSLVDNNNHRMPPNRNDCLQDASIRRIIFRQQQLEVSHP